MINADFRNYNYFTLGLSDGYGMPTITDKPAGTIKMAIYLANISNQDNILYKDATYVGLTMDKNIDDTYFIDYGKDRLKVLNINPSGRYKVVYLTNVN